ncbi:MAG: biopolymer transporter ExbD [Bacteroidia bacterium]|nr:biopolymer transporter ExbD [Bacteroidia bacterium]
MPKLKLPTKSPHIDMTPMVDLLSLLLTFFMLTTSFRPQEAALIDTPTSISEKQTPDKNVMTILIGKDDKIYFNIDNGRDTSTKVRANLLEEMGKRYNIAFTKEEIAKFSKLSSFGLNIKDLKKWINAESKDREAMEVGIPTDSTDNQLSWWVFNARLLNPDADVAIKGDAEASYKTVKKLLDMLQEKKVNKFALTTTLVKVDIKASDIK